jgi:hypothetical protein
MNIKKINLGRLRNEAHFQFLTAFIALVDKFVAIKVKIADLFELLLGLFAKEDLVVDFITKSDHTGKIAEANHRLDRTLVGFGEIIRGALHHFDPNVAEAAQSLLNRLKSYGKIISKSYDEEIAAVTNLLQDLGSPYYQEKINLIDGLNPWVEEINAANLELIRLLETRNVETAGKPQERMVDVRREIDPVLRRIIERIGALALIEGEEEYAAFINEFNALADRFSRIQPHKTATENKNDGGQPAV